MMALATVTPLGITVTYDSEREQTLQIVSQKKKGLTGEYYLRKELDKAFGFSVSQDEILNAIKAWNKRNAQGEYASD